MDLFSSGVKTLVQQLLGCLGTSVTGIATDVGNLSQNSRELEEQLQEFRRVRRQLESLRDKHGPLVDNLHKEAEHARQLLSPSSGEGPLELVQRSGQVKLAKTNLSKFLEEARQLLKSTSLAEELRLRRECDTSKPNISFGAEAVVNEMIRAIIDGRHQWIALTGMGGIGKTFTARTVYNDPSVRNHFEGTFWITVSKDNPPAHILLGELFEKISRTASADDFQGDLERAKAKLKSLIENGSGRIFLVMDDVWEPDIIKCLDEILEEDRGTILVTTRRQEILRTVRDCTKIVEVKTLSAEQSWDLFSWHAFRKGKMPNDLDEDVAREVADECGGLPLALQVIGATMRGKQVVPREEATGKTLTGEWKNARDELRRASSYMNDLDPLYHKLQLSVNDLRIEDPRLVDFLGYFAAFPEDYKVSGKELRDMWVAEHLVRNGNASSTLLENDANILLRSLVVKFVIDETTEYGNDVYTIHDVMRDLARWNLKWNFDKNIGIRASERKCLYEPGWTESGFPREWTAPDAGGYYLWKALREWIVPETSGVFQAERLSLYGSCITSLPDRFNAPRLRMLFLSNSVRLCTLPPGFFCSLSSLTVLNLSGTGVKEISDAVLRVLKNLTVLDLSDCGSLRKVSNEINSLLTLEEVKLLGCFNLEKLPRVGNLKNLRTFSALICLEFNMACDRLDFSQRWCDYLSFRGLSKYGIWELFQLPNLKRITLGTGLEKGAEVYLPNISCLAMLEVLRLRDLPLPAGMIELQTLKVLEISGEIITELPGLGGLRLLEKLELSSLGISTFPESFRNEAAFPSLRSLRIYGCDN